MPHVFYHFKNNSLASKYNKWCLFAVYYKQIVPHNSFEHWFQKRVHSLDPFVTSMAVSTTRRIRDEGMVWFNNSSAYNL